MRRHFKRIGLTDKTIAYTPGARSVFGVHLHKDWWGFDKDWAPVIENVFPSRKFSLSGNPWPKLKPVRFDETISVVNGWFHCTGFGTLQRLFVIILKSLSHQELQTFYLILDAQYHQKLHINSAPRTNAKNFFMKPKSKIFKRRISKMVMSYGHTWVAADALETVIGYEDDRCIVLRQWVSLCTAFFFDMDGRYDGPPRRSWEGAMSRLIDESLFPVCLNLKIS